MIGAIDRIGDSCAQTRPRSLPGRRRGAAAYQEVYLVPISAVRLMGWFSTDPPIFQNPTEIIKRTRGKFVSDPLLLSIYRIIVALFTRPFGRKSRFLPAYLGGGGELIDHLCKGRVQSCFTKPFVGQLSRSRYRTNLIRNKVPGLPPPRPCLSRAIQSPPDSPVGDFNR